jgi:hypothetical protein
MQQSRRDLFKAATVGAVGATLFGFDLRPLTRSSKSRGLQACKKSMAAAGECRSYTRQPRHLVVAI